MANGESVPATPGQEPQVDENNHSNLRRTLVGGLVVLAAGAGGVGLAIEASNTDNESGIGAPSAVAVSSESQAITNCDNVVDAHAASDKTIYAPSAFLPDYSAQSPEEAKQEVFDFFSKDGPLADHADYESLANLMSTLYDPAHQGGFENVDYDYVNDDNAEMGRLTGNKKSAERRAKVDCKDLVTQMSQDVGYNADWATPGETVTEVAAVRDSSYNVVGEQLERGTVKHTLRGIEFVERTTSKGENGYYSVLISTDSVGVENGTEFIKGISKAQFNGTSTSEHGHLPQKVNHNSHPVPNGNASGLGGNVETVTSHITGAGKGQGVSVGAAAPESLPNGPNTGKGTGPSHPNGPAQAKSGPGKSPGTGGGSGGGGGGGKQGGGGGGGIPPTTVTETTPSTPPPTTVTETTPSTPPPTTVTETTPSTPPPTTVTETTPSTPPPTTVTETTPSTPPPTTTTYKGLPTAPGGGSPGA